MPRPQLTQRKLLPARLPGYWTEEAIPSIGLDACRKGPRSLILSGNAAAEWISPDSAALPPQMCQRGGPTGGQPKLGH
jgi:hypothetical protein